MKSIAFKMKLYDGYAAEYKKRHEEIWPGIVELLKEAGVSDYYLFLDEATNDIFASFKVANPKVLEELGTKEIMQKWWAHMADIMESHADTTPVITPLTEMFYLE